MKFRALFVVSLLVAGSVLADTPADRTTIPILDEVTLKASCTQSLLEAKEEYAKLEATPVDQATVDTILNKCDEIKLQVENVIGPVAILANVHPDKKVRDAADDCLVKASTFQTDIFQSEKLFERVNAVKTSSVAEGRLRQDLIEQFEDSGVALPKDKRARAKEITERITTLGQEFEKNLRDNTTKLTFTPAEYKGLPQSYIDRTKNAKGNLVVGFDYPDVGPFMNSSENEKARERYYIANTKRGGARNLAILDEVTKLRKELATLYGYP